MSFLRLFLESFKFALGSLIVNKLRTILSLLGITIGIFTIISVFSVLDSLENNIKDKISSIGNDMIYIQKWPWAMGKDYPWWKYLNRPVPSVTEYNALKKRSHKASLISFMSSTSKTIGYLNNSAENIPVIAGSYEFDKVRKFELEKGRYYSPFEYNSGKNLIIIGHDLAKTLFETRNPIGKRIKVGSRKFSIIGIFKKEGTSLMGNSLDNMALISVNAAKKFMNVNDEMYNPQIIVKPKKNVELAALEEELRMIMRSLRKLKPTAEDNFAFNQASMLSQGIEKIFSMINLAGLFIGGFSILIGGFGIANIMFVSVKERTKMIGIQKAIGAKKAFILLQFLFESVLLSLLGGVVGLLLVFFGFLIANHFIDMTFYLGWNNILLGMFISFVIGIISGYAPARSAARLNPVVAINSTF